MLYYCILHNIVGGVSETRDKAHSSAATDGRSELRAQQGCSSIESVAAERILGRTHLVHAHALNCYTTPAPSIVYIYIYIYIYVAQLSISSNAYLVSVSL